MYKNIQSPFFSQNQLSSEVSWWCLDITKFWQNRLHLCVIKSQYIKYSCLVMFKFWRASRSNSTDQPMEGITPMGHYKPAVKDYKHINTPWWLQPKNAPAHWKPPNSPQYLQHCWKNCKKTCSTGYVVGQWKENFEDLHNYTVKFSMEETEAEDLEGTHPSKAEVTEVVGKLLGTRLQGWMWFVLCTLSIWMLLDCLGWHVSATLLGN